MRKRKSALFLLAFAAAVCMPLYAAASSANCHVRVDQSTNVCVDLENNPGIASWMMELSWDSALLQLDDVSCGDSYSGGVFIKNSTVPGKLTATWYSASDVTADGILLTASFSSVNPNAASCPVRISYSAADTVNEQGQKIALQFDKTSVSVQIEEVSDNPVSTPSDTAGSSDPPAQTDPVVPPLDNGERFSDVHIGDFCYDAVNWAVKQSITGGISKHIFAPNALCTRAQAVTFLWRSFGSPEPSVITAQFSDVDPSAYYYKAVMWALENGITEGTGQSTFSPNNTVTRAQLVTFLWRGAGKEIPAAGNTFSDVAQSSYYAVPVSWAVGRSITLGTSANTFSPNAMCTRAQTVTFLYRFANSVT